MVEEDRDSIDDKIYDIPDGFPLKSGKFCVVKELEDIGNAVFPSSEVVDIIFEEDNIATAIEIEDDSLMTVV